MFCIKCGIELSGNQTVCPICSTKVYHPDIPQNQTPPSYPKKDFQSEAINRKGILFVITILYLLPLLLPMIFEIAVSSTVNWSGYVAGGTLLSYLFFILPSWFKTAHPIIFVPSYFLATMFFVWYVNFATEGNWFYTFALPVLGSLAIIVSTLTTLVAKLRRGKLYVIGGSLIAVGLWTVLIEWLLHYTFSVTHTVYWSLFCLISLFILGMMLITIAIVKPWKESLRRFFFLD